MKTGLLTHSMCTAHEMGSWHPECPARLAAIQDQLIASGLAPLLEHIDAPPASLDAIMRAHAREYVQALQSRAPERGYLALDPDTSMNPSTWQAALHAAGAVVEATDPLTDEQAGAVQDQVLGRDTDRQSTAGQPAACRAAGRSRGCGAAPRAAA